jgi:hypothetical protein
VASTGRNVGEKVISIKDLQKILNASKEIVNKLKGK